MGIMNSFVSDIFEHIAGHKAKDCNFESVCSLCGVTGYTFFSCPGSYVNKTKASQRQESTDTQQRLQRWQPSDTQQRPQLRQPSDTQQRQQLQQSFDAQQFSDTQQLQQPSGIQQRPQPSDIQQPKTRQDPMPFSDHCQPGPEDILLSSSPLPDEFPSLSGEQSSSTNSDDDNDSENDCEQQYESASESPSSDFLSDLTAVQRASTPLLPPSAPDPVQSDQNSGNFSTTPEFPPPDMRVFENLEQCNFTKKRRALQFSNKREKRLDKKPTP
ncbi:hypothetical protein D5F01_LYC00835 [Larimichthys crocea]|uniref:Uncharacterized protein n=1 Tax=Larimichthys crocea TaxID=215358 RepID=A0A6G0JAB2_LARCR|nr:hypothetical protein D5F01_LYC00835 [Larimichthys crocea]